jgi:hypothetical protein
MIGALLHHDGSARNNHRTEVTEVTEGEVTEEEGVMEYWSNGVLEYWSIGGLEGWRVGDLVEWRFGG